MAAPKNWNKAAGYEMWKAGKCDKEIAEAVGVSASAVSVHRRKYWGSGEKKVVLPTAEKATPAEVHEEESMDDMEDVKIASEQEALVQDGPHPSPCDEPQGDTFPQGKANPSDENQRFSPAPLEGEPRGAEEPLGAEDNEHCAGGLPRRSAPRNDSENCGLTEAQLQVMAMELYVKDLKGMDAVLTFQILDALWNWKSVEELKQAKVLLDYLIERLDGNA